ncbi:hypothetical protein FBEOM_2765 [Fusarium beomiforme]|uniref:LDB19 N-terminal domain-containing protein n=1 Tax=Fusarium beomiforme TaxID=44412 RepID=A0A9P5E234_9HYPO|nr:hypothetical protein FBEOM_2765 [Fusarium beomiforme]
MTGLSHLIRPQVLTPPLLKKGMPKSPNTPPASLDCQINASPIVIDNASDSDGSAISGSLLFNIEETVEVDSLFAVLRVHVAHKKPFKRTCKACKHKVTELKRCHFIETNTTLCRNSYTYPFSYRVPSYVPASMDTSVVSVTYEFEAIASMRRTGSTSQMLETVKLNRNLSVVRSVPVPSKSLRSSRIYQAAGIEVDCSFDPVMDLSRKNQVTLTMSGLRSCPGNGEDVQFWRVCKGTWILKETIKSTAMPCTKHVQESEDKSHEQKKTIILGEASFYNGWTIDDNAGTLNMQFPFSIRKSSTRYTQDTGDVGDTSVTHSLVLELQLMKETYPKGNPDLSVRTGVGRILRSEHRVVLSNHARRSDYVTDERLPCYNDLWPAPPVYGERDLE